MPKKLTDNQLALLYLGFTRDYKDLTGRGFTPQLIYANLYSRLHYSFTDKFSSLYGMNRGDGFNTDEFEKIETVLNTFFSSTPQFREIPPEERALIFRNKVTPIPIGNNEHYYCLHEDSYFIWQMLNSYINSSQNPKKKGSKAVKAIVFLLLLVLGLLTAVAALIAVYYMFNQFLNSMERFVYNEGWMQASITIAAIVGGIAAASLFGTFIAAAPLMALAFVTGVGNPVGVAVFSIVCLSIVGAALACGLTNWIQNKAIESHNKDAIDPQDPHRFEVTEKEEQNMLDNGIDPIKVKCAIVELRKKIGEEETPNLINRLFTKKGGEKQGYLKLVRQLRRGELQTIIVGDMQFELLKIPPNYFFSPPVSGQQPHPNPYNPEHPNGSGQGSSFYPDPSQQGGFSAPPYNDWPQYPEAYPGFTF